MTSSVTGDSLTTQKEISSERRSSLTQVTEAFKDWDKAILRPVAEQPGPRQAGAAMRLQAGQVDEAVAEVAELDEKRILARWFMVQLCLHPPLPAARVPTSSGKYRPGDGPVAKCRKAGWSDAAHMAKDKDLDAIRGREDFKKLIEELAAKPG